MNEIQIFNHPQFGDIRTAGTQDNPLFCLSDICRVLDLRVSPTKDRLDERGVSQIDTPTKNQYGATVMQQMYFVNEKNLYKVIMRSDKPQAEPFQDWVCGEVLPSIRKHGAYMSEQVIERTLSDPDYLIQLATTLKDERKARLEAEQRAAALTMENMEKQQKIEADKPKVTFADAIIGSRTSCLIGQLAKVLSQNGYKIGQNRLFKWLRDNHYLGSWGSYYNLPYQVYVEQGLFEVKYTTHSENERMVTSATTKVTGKGQQYFINLFINKQPILI